MAQSPQLRIAVIGAGWAGLSAAVRLCRAGARVTVFESAREPGGRARALDWVDDRASQRIDNGQHIMIGAYRETLELMALVKDRAEDGLRRTPLTLADSRGLRLAAWPLPAPLHMALGLMAARGLSAASRWAMLRLMQQAKRIRFRLKQDVTVLEWLSSNRQPAELVERLWAPLCVAALNTPATIASAQIFLNVLRDSLAASRHASDLLLPSTTLDAILPHPAVACLKRDGAVIHLGHAISLVTEQTAGVRLDTREDHELFDAAVVAVPAHQVSTLLAAYQGDQWEALRQSCSAMTWQTIATCYLVYDRAVVLAEPMLALAEDAAQQKFGQWVFAKGQLGGRADTLAVVISASGPHLDLSHTDLAALIDKQVRHQLAISATLIASRVITEKRATFAAVPGLRRPAIRTPSARVVLAGDYTDSDYPATLESAVSSGRRAAELILELGEKRFRPESGEVV